MVAPILWEESYAVGVQEFDEDHRHLFQMANEVVRTAEVGGSETDMRAVLDDLIEEAVVHFEHEEAIMEKSGYPGLVEHREAHNRLVRTFIKYRSELRFERLQIDDVAEFILDWLAVHIKTLDRAYSRYLNGAGIR